MKQNQTDSCGHCGGKRAYSQMTLHADHRYYGRCCITIVNGELAAAMAENKWDHEFDARPNQWWPS